MENLHNKRSLRPFIIIAGVMLALLIVVAAIIGAIGGNDSPAATTTESEGTTSSVATDEQVKESLQNLESSQKQATELQANAKAALEDEKKQIKVGE